MASQTLLEQFTRDLRTAIAAAHEAAAASDDGGTCNLDTLVVSIPHARAASVQKAALAAGALYASRGQYAGQFHIGIAAVGQANSRTRAVQAAKRALAAAGWQAHVHYVTGLRTNR